MNKLILTFIIMLFSGAALAEKTKSISVIVHADNTTDTLTKKQLIDLYMGRYVAFPDNQSAQPVDTLTPEGLKNQFYKRLVNMPLSRVNAYWSRVKFTGRATPPSTQDSEQVLLNFIANNPNAIGYVFSDSLSLKDKQDVKVIMELYE
ncbi:hypothetical protein [Pseudoalteromonas phenolica]|nr:hypothetical protein [Pseudoalteromonas phenolica]